MTATMTPPNNAKEASPPKSDAIDRIHLDLDEMVSRLRREILIGGVLAVGTAMMASLLALLVIDAIFQPESAGMRVAMWLPLIGIVGLVARRFLIVPLQSECNRLAMAWTLEQKQPAIEERLTTSLQLTETPNGKSSELIEAVAQQARGSLAGCQDEDLRGQEVLRRTIIAGACVATFVLSMWIWAAYLIPSLQNVLSPWSSRVLPHLNATILPGDTHVGEGHDLRVTATGNHLTDAVLEVIENDAVIASHQMATDDNNRVAEFTLTGLKNDCQYRVRAGGLFSGRYQIVVDPKPVIERFEVGLRFPEYTRVAPQVLRQLSGPIEVIHGTQVRIDMDATLPCAESTLTLNGKSTPCNEPVPIEETALWRHRWEFTATESDRKHGEIELVSEAGVPSEPFPFDLRILPDLPPSIIIDQPALPDIKAKEDGTIDVAFHAYDDFGCGQLQLISQKNGEPTSAKDVPHDPGKEFTGELAIDLKEQELTSGDTLTVWLSISDSRPDEYGGPQVADSQKIRIRIADDAKSVGQQVVQKEAQALLDNLTKALENLRAAEQITDDLRTDLGEGDDKAELPKAPVDAAEKSKQLQAQINEAEKALRELSTSDDAASEGLFPEETKRIQDVTKKEVAEAKKQAGLVPLSDDRPQQREAITATKKSLSNAIEKLEKVRKDIDQRGKQLELAAKLDALARQQDRLEKKFDEGQNNAPNVQEKQRQVADALQEFVEQDLDAKSQQFTQRAEKAAELTEEAAELQKQQEDLAKLDQVRSQEELDDQLLEMIAKEQEQIANETRKLEERAGDISQPAADTGKQPQQKNHEAKKADQNKKPNALAEARKQMESVTEKLRQKDLKQAEFDAKQAGEHLQEQTKSVPQNAAAKPNPNDEDKSSAKKEDLKRLAKQQERVRDAIKAVREERPDEAVAKLQEQIADRTERLRDKAEELLQLPTEDAENQQAVREAREKLEQAQKETKAAEQLTKPKQKPAGDPKKADEQKQQAGDPKKADEQKQPAGDPKKADEQKQPAGDPKKADEQKQPAGDPKKADEQKQQADDPKKADEQKQPAGDPKKANEQKQPAGDPKKANEQKQPAGDPKKADEQKQPAGDPKKVDEQKQPAGDPKKADEQKKQGEQKKADEQKKQAAKSLKEAMQSLEKVCKSCKKCSKCNKPSSSSSSGGGSPKSGGSKSEGSQPNGSKPDGKQPNGSKPDGNKPDGAKPDGNKPDGAKPDGNKPDGAKPDGAKPDGAKPDGTKPGESKGQQPDPRKLAEAADKAHQTAREPSPNKTKELAQDLNQLADEAAKRAGYPNRNSKPGDNKPNPPNSPNSSQQAGAGRPGTEPGGVKGNPGADQTDVGPTQLRGRSTSNWTQSRSKLKSNVLDDQDSKIPEEFRGVVKDYFEELSRLQSGKDTTEDQK